MLLYLCNRWIIFINMENWEGALRSRYSQYILCTSWTKIIYINSFYNQCTVSNNMYLDAHLPAKTCEAPRCVCSLYTPAHHMNWLQLLTHTLNTAYCHCSCQQSHLKKCSVTLHSGTNIHTGRLILKRSTVLRLYTDKIIGDLLDKAHKSYFIIQD